MARKRFDAEYASSRTVALAESGCWIWMLATVKGGYGKISYREPGNRAKSVLAHRAIWEEKNGPIPDGMLLCHTCDVSSCVNPDHMFLGTHADNSADMVKKGRSVRGEQVSHSILTRDDVLRLRGMSGTNKAIAQELGVSESSVWYARNNVTWRHVQ